MANASSCPESILVLIPWYPDGLAPEECGAVEAHAADCRACRAELAFLRGGEEPSIELPDTEQVYARVLERIAAVGEDEAPAALPVATSVESFTRRAAGPVSVAAGLLVALLSGMLTTGVIWVARVAPTYETASATAPMLAAAPSAQLEVVFRDDATAEEIRAALRGAEATLVSGPSQLGVYRVRLADDADVDAAVKQLRGDGQGVATLVEPAAG